MKNPIWVDGQKSIQKQSTWQERFDKKFPDLPKTRNGNELIIWRNISSARVRDIHSFIVSERVALLKEIGEIVEGMRKNSNYTDDKIYNEPRRQEYGFNLALSEVQELIKKKI